MKLKQRLKQSSSSSFTGAKQSTPSPVPAATKTTTSTTTFARSSRSLGVGVSFGDIVALDSFDTSEGTSTTAENGFGTPRRVSSSSGVRPNGREGRRVATDSESSSGPEMSSSSMTHTPPRRMHTMPAVATKLAPAPPIQRVTVPDLGGEACHLSPDEEQSKVKMVWDRLSDDERSRLSDPSMIVRHVRADKGNVDKALHKCQGAIRWRSSFGVESMHEWIDILRRENGTGKIYVRGYDAEGRAYLYMRPANQNTCNEHEQMQHLVWNLEKAIACTRRKSVELGAKRPLEKINLVIDYHGFTLRNAPSMSASKYTLDILQKYYPERMHRAYCVNAPRVFQTFFMLIKAFIDPATKEKIVFVTTDDCSKLVSNTERVDKLEPSVGGPPDAREFDTNDYLSLPFDVSFDEFGAEI
jgi:CRAL/TRIO domain